MLYYVPMKRISVISLKGGVGKSSIVAGLGLALRDKGLKVGFIDIDVTGSNLYSALGLDHSPKWILDTSNKRVIVPFINGVWLLSISSHTGEDFAVLWEGSQNKELESMRALLDATTLSVSELAENLTRVRDTLDSVIASSKWRYVTEILSDDIVTWPEPLDFQITDMPPSTSTEMFSYLENCPDLFGVFIVTQPSVIATTGLRRTIDLLRNRQIPIMGLVINQDGYITRQGELEYQFLSPRADIESIAAKTKIPILLSIPQTGEPERARAYFSALADRILEVKPFILSENSIKRKVKRKVAKSLVRNLL